MIHAFISFNAPPSPQVSIGLLGVISEVTFQCEPAFNLREMLYNIKLSDCLEEMADTARRSEHVKWWVEMHSDLCAVFEINRTTEAPRDNPNHLVETILVCTCACMYVCEGGGGAFLAMSDVFLH